MGAFSENASHPAFSSAVDCASFGTSPLVRLDFALRAVFSSLIKLFLAAALPLVWDGLKHCSTPLTKAFVSEITRSTWSTRGSGAAARAVTKGEQMARAIDRATAIVEGIFYHTVA